MNIPADTRSNIDARDLQQTIENLRNKALQKTSEANKKVRESELLIAEARGLNEGADALEARVEKLVKEIPAEKTT